MSLLKTYHSLSSSIKAWNNLLFVTHSATSLFHFKCGIVNMNKTLDIFHRFCAVFIFLDCLFITVEAECFKQSTISI